MALNQNRVFAVSQVIIDYITQCFRPSGSPKHSDVMSCVYDLNTEIQYSGYFDNQIRLDHHFKESDASISKIIETK